MEVKTAALLPGPYPLSPNVMSPVEKFQQDLDLIKARGGNTSSAQKALDAHNADADQADAQLRQKQAQERAARGF